MRGELLQKGTLNGTRTEVDLAYPNGIYLIKLSSAEGIQNLRKFKLAGLFYVLLNYARIVKEK
jgi:hypothetical protein